MVRTPIEAGADFLLVIAAPSPFLPRQHSGLLQQRCLSRSLGTVKISSCGGCARQVAYHAGALQNVNKAMTAKWVSPSRPWRRRESIYGLHGRLPAANRRKKGHLLCECLLSFLLLLLLIVKRQVRMSYLQWEELFAASRVLPALEIKTRRSFVIRLT